MSEIKRTRVVNRRIEQEDVYVGRGSKWGNPWSHLPASIDTKAQFRVATREEAIEKYREYIQTRPDLLAALPELKGKRLGCYCKPSACHAEVLVELIEGKEQESLF